MSGGLVQLVATGAQDTWLTGKPEISFFRSNYKRYTQYALSSERQIIQGNPAAGSISTIRFEKKGDLMSYVYFIGKDTNGALIPGIDWSKVIDKVELLIGGQVIDTQDITWMTQIEPVTGAQNLSQRWLNNDLAGLTNVINGFLPLKFFFCKDWSVALPLVALQYHDVEIRITWSPNLGYRVGYELYAFQGTAAPNRTTGVTATTSPSIGSAVAAIALGGATSTSVTNPVLNFGQFGAVITNPTGLSALSNYQANAFSYTSANCAIYPGLGFTIGSNIMTITTVNPTSTTSGSFLAYSNAVPGTTAYSGGSIVFSANAFSNTQWTGSGFATTSSPPQTFFGTLTKAGAGGFASNILPVNSIITSGAPGGTGASYFYLSGINFTSDTTATAYITGVGTFTSAPSQTAFNTTFNFVPWYPVINMGTAGVTGTIPTNAAIVGQASLTSVATVPTVNTVYPAGVVSINNLTSPAGVLGGGGVGDTTWNVNVSLSTSSLFYIPPSYQVATINSVSTGTFTTTPATVTVPLANFVANGTVSQTVPSVIPGSSTLFFNAATTTTAISNAYVQTFNSSTGSSTVNYTNSTSGAALPAGTQVVIVPGPTTATLNSIQQSVDRSGAAIVSVNNLAGTVPVTVGQAVLGTQYAGPVIVSSIVSQTSGAAGAGTAVFEVNFPTQSLATNSTTGVGTLIQFVSPTNYASYAPLVSYQNVGFNGTYQQLQYEAWCSFLYLDQAERQYFASTPMDMLITQVNRVPINPLMTHDVNLAHPVKFLAFLSNSYTSAYATQATTGISAAAYAFKTQLNGVDVGDSRSLFQWQDVPQYYHTPFGYKSSGAAAPVTLISYCLDTSKLQPTGTLNFSRLDSYRIITPPNSTLSLLAGGAGYIYAVNYNVLRVQKGMGSMLYSS